MSALSTRPTRGELAATTSTACLITPITSSHSPSTLVNIAFVSQGSPEARTTRTASATASLTPPCSSPDVGLMLKATIMGQPWHAAQPGQRVAGLRLHGPDRDAEQLGGL